MATSSSAIRRRAWIAIALLAAACTTEREPAVRPFEIQATLDGAPAPAGVTQVFGVAARLDGATLRATSADGHVLEVSFDGAEAHVELPADLDGQPIGLVVFVDEAHRGPHGEPLRVPAFQVLDVVDGQYRYRFLLGEGTYRNQGERPVLPLLFFPPNPTDFPSLAIVPDNLYFEPAQCGFIYYDRLRILVEARHDLPFDSEQRVRFGEPAADWTVRHVLSWHRTGDCPHETKTWTQAVMWRS